MRWSRADSRVLEIVLAVGTALVLVFGLAVPLLGPTGTGWLRFGEDGPVIRVSAELSDPVPVPGAPTLGSGGVDGGNPDEVGMSGADRVDVTFPAPTGSQRVLYLVGPLLVSGTALAVLVLLFVIVGSLRAGEPFTRSNARRVSAIGVALAAGGTFAPLITDMTHAALLHPSAAGPLVRTNEFTVSFVWLAVGMVVAAVGEVFRRGVVLREDVDGLV